MTQSPLANLSNVLRIVKESANNYDSTLRKNEAATRAVLIDPVLRALDVCCQDHAHKSLM